MEFPSVSEDGQIEWGLTPRTPPPQLESQVESYKSSTSVESSSFGSGIPAFKPIQQTSQWNFAKHFENQAYDTSFLSSYEKADLSKRLAKQAKKQNDCEEYSVHIGTRDIFGKHPVSIMRFGNLGIDPSLWKSCKMGKEIKQRKKPSAFFTTPVAKLPVEGAGSEYGADIRVERQRNRMDRKRRMKEVRDKETQPWNLRLNYVDGLHSRSETIKTKRFKGQKVGGITDNASYFVFVEKEEYGEIRYEAFPVDNWFDFRPIQCYKSLSATQAEEKFQQRNEIFNYFCVMAKKGVGIANENNDDKENQQLKPVACGLDISTCSNSSSTTCGSSSSSSSEDEDSDDKAKQTSCKRRKISRDKQSSRAGIMMMDVEEDGDEPEIEFMSSSDLDSSSSSENNSDDERCPGENDGENKNDQQSSSSSSLESDEDERFS